MLISMDYINGSISKRSDIIYIYELPCFVKLKMLVTFAGVK